MRRSIMFLSILRVDRLLCRSTHRINWNTIVHASSSATSLGNLAPKSVNIAQTMAICIDLRRDSSCSCFNWLNFFCILCTLDWTWDQVHGGVNGNASSILNKISCHCCCVRLFMLLARSFSSSKSINNAVESSFQSLGFLRGAGGAAWGRMDKGRAWTHHHLGQETWLLRKFHGEKKMWFKEKIEKHSACIVCSEKDRRKCDSKKKNEKHSACIVCSEKMPMECRQVSTWWV